MLGARGQLVQREVELEHELQCRVPGPPETGAAFISISSVGTRCFLKTTAFLGPFLFV